MKTRTANRASKYTGPAASTGATRISGSMTNRSRTVPSLGPRTAKRQTFKKTVDRRGDTQAQSGLRMNLGDVFESSPRLSAAPEFEISAKEREELLQRRDAERVRIEEADHLARKNKMELEIASVKHKIEPAKLFLTEMRVQLSQETNEWTKRTLRDRIASAEEQLEMYKQIVSEENASQMVDPNNSEGAKEEKLVKLEHIHTGHPKFKDWDNILQHGEHMLSMLKNSHPRATESDRRSIIARCLDPSVSARIGSFSEVNEMVHSLLKDSFGPYYKEDMIAGIKNYPLEDAGGIREHHAAFRRKYLFLDIPDVHTFYAKSLTGDLSVRAYSFPVTMPMETCFLEIEEMARARSKVVHTMKPKAMATKSSAQSMVPTEKPAAGMAARSQPQTRTETGPNDLCVVHQESDHTNGVCNYQKVAAAKVLAKKGGTGFSVCGFCEELAKTNPRIKVNHPESNCFKKYPELRQQRALVLKSCMIDIDEEDVSNDDPPKSHRNFAEGDAATAFSTSPGLLAIS
ncbi:hypothetical protein HDU98_002665 [Podochytrium sp. JEL0797]|nr:hypothetical protein HDU98_002665 [Podochytrium sp. JEL0797]